MDQETKLTLSVVETAKLLGFPGTSATNWCAARSYQLSVLVAGCLSQKRLCMIS